MNKTFKIIYSKARNCYVVASELAKSRTKSPKLGVFSRTVVAGVLAAVIFCGAAAPAMASTTVWSSSGVMEQNLPDNVSLETDLSNASVKYLINGNRLYMAKDLITGAVRFYGYKTVRPTGDDVYWTVSLIKYTNNEVKTMLGASSIDDVISAVTGGGSGDGDTVTSVKAGKGLTVTKGGTPDAPEYTVAVKDGSVANGNTGLINGDKLYAEVRPSDNGNYVKHAKFNMTNFLII